MRVLRLAPFFVLMAVPLSAQAQVSSGGFISRLGRDTVFVERFTRTQERVEGELVVIAPRVRLLRYEGRLDARGRVVQFELTNRPAVEGPGIPPAITWTAALDDTLATIIIRRPARTDTVRYAVGPVAAPDMIASVAMQELAIAQGLRAGGDSVAATLYGPNARQARASYVARRGADTVATDAFGLPFHFRVDRSGRVLGGNGMRTTIKTMVERQPTLDVAAIAESFAARERAGQAAGALSTRDTARATIGSGAVWVDYGRPTVRGRVIYGGVVPWGEVWRTGANAATQLNTAVDLQVGDQVIPAGFYTLWTVPTRDGVTLLVNRQTGQWGTAHDPAQDFLRLPLRVESLPMPVERFTISIEGSGTGGELRFDWDRTRWVLPFTVK